MKGYEGGEALALHYTSYCNDILYGRIGFTTLEEQVIAHPFFQRLRKLKQLAFSEIDFPGATHSRYEHSLGVCHLSEKLLEALVFNQSTLLKSSLDLPQLTKSADCCNYLNDNMDYMKQVTRLAALLHDIGHGPFSHSSEPFFIAWGDFVTKIDLDGTSPDNSAALLEEFTGVHSPYSKEVLHALQKKLRVVRGKYGPKWENQRVRHEFYSVMISLALLQDIGASSGLIRDVLSVLDRDFERDNSGESHVDMSFQLLSLIISSELDADRLDYLRRDMTRTGVAYTGVNVHNLLSNMIFFVGSDDSVHLAFQRNGLIDFELFLLGRWIMYTEVYLTPGGAAPEAMLDYVHEEMNRLGAVAPIPLDIHQFTKLHDSVFLAHLKDGLEAVAGAEGALSVLADLETGNYWKLVHEETTVEESGKEPSSIRPVLDELERNEIPHKLLHLQARLTGISSDKRRKSGAFQALMVSTGLDGKPRGEFRSFQHASRVILKADSTLQYYRVYSRSYLRVKDEEK
jgi:HD superfamily phosphohydrolase